MFREYVKRVHSTVLVSLVWLKFQDLEEILIYDDYSIFPDDVSDFISPLDGRIALWRKLPNIKVFEMKPIARFEASERGWEAALAAYDKLEKTIYDNWDYNLLMVDIDMEGLE